MASRASRQYLYSCTSKARSLEQTAAQVLLHLHGLARRSCGGLLQLLSDDALSLALALLSLSLSLRGGACRQRAACRQGWRLHVCLLSCRVLHANQACWAPAQAQPTSVPFLKHSPAFCRALVCSRFFKGHPSGILRMTPPRPFQTLLARSLSPPPSLGVRERLKLSVLLFRLVSQPSSRRKRCTQVLERKRWPPAVPRCGSASCPRCGSSSPWRPGTQRLRCQYSYCCTRTASKLPRRAALLQMQALARSDAGVGICTGVPIWY
jgi:hypothetical protein